MIRRHFHISQKEIMIASESTYQNTSISASFIAVSSISSSLSILGTIFIFLTYLSWKEIRISSRRILVYISIADFFTAFGNMISVIHERKEGVLCQVQSFITTTSSLWSFFWSTFMAVFLFFTVARKQPAFAERLLCGFHICAWGFPVLITGLALYKEVLGDDKDHFTAGWCWIKDMGGDRKKQLMWMWFTGKGWEIATYCLIVVFYGALKWHICTDINYKHQQFTTRVAREAAIKADRKLTFVPIVFILCRIWGTMRFLLDVGGSDWHQDSLVPLLYLQGIGDSGQGFANFMLFCFFTDKFQGKFRRLCCFKRPSSSSRNESTYRLPDQENDTTPSNPINEHTSLLPNSQHS